MKKLFLMLCFLCSAVSLMASGSVSGTVTTALSVPLPGATVTLFQGSSTVVATTTTAGNGTYSFSGVAAGEYVVRSSLLTFQTGVAGVTVIDGQNSTANFSLGSNPGAISGQVLDNVSHLPIVGATVGAIQNNVLVGSATTNGSGNYAINGLSAGAYVVNATASGHQADAAGAAVVGGQTTTANFSLVASPGTISGTVTSANGGLPISGALVQVSNGGTVLYSALTNGSGNYAITGVAAGSYTVAAVAAGFTTGVAGATVTAGGMTTASFSLQLAPGTVSGTVTSGGVAISGAQVEVKLGNVVVNTAVTDNGGGYSISGVAPGTYVVDAYASGFQTGTAGAIVVSNSTATANFSLVANPGTISGTVTAASGGLPIVSTLVQVINGSSVVASTLTDSSGNFTIAGVAPGSYTVSADAAGFQTAVQGAAVSSDQTTTVDFALTASPGVISGTVVSAVGSTPISGALVQVTLDNTVLFSTVTDSSGNYSISGVAPGVYVVDISANGFQAGVSGAIVAASATTTVNVSLQASPGTIAGTVVSASGGAPISGALVEVNLGNTVVSSAETNNAGGFSISGVAPGAYVVDVYATNYQTGVSGAVVVSNSTATIGFSLQPNPGTITGSVTSASGGLPIASALVQVIDGTAIIDAILTDSSGNFAISGVAPGSYTISVTAAAHQSAALGAVVSSGQTTTVNAALAASPGTISGTVIAAVGSTPIAGASVEIALDNVVLFSTVTDSSGNYSILGVAPGSYAVRVSANGFQAGVVGAIVLANVTTTVNLSLAASPGTISGTVTSASGGAPIAGVLVEANLMGVVTGSAVTNSAGSYSIPGLSPGVYVVNAYAAGYQTGTIGATVVANGTTTANFSLAANPGTVTGAVIATSGGSPIAGALVQLIYNGAVVDSILTNSSGVYSVAGLVPGSYDITAEATGFSAGIASANLSAGQTATVNFSLASAPGFISGTVVSTVGSTPIAGAVVEVDLNGVLIFSALTNSSGNYSVTGLAPNTYAVRAQASAHQAQLNQAVVVVPNAGTTSNFSLPANPAQVQGQVTDGISGQPLPGVFIELFEGGNSIGTVVTDSSGNYTFGALAADNYTLTASLNNYISKSSSFSVSAGGTATVNLSLIPNFPPSNLAGTANTNAFLLQADRISRLQWDAALGGNIANYRIYRNGLFLANVSPNGSLEYNDHNRSARKTDSYSVTAVNTSGNESTALTITLP